MTIIRVDVNSSEAIVRELQHFAAVFDSSAIEIAQTASMAMLVANSPAYLGSASSYSRVCASRIAVAVAELKRHQIQFKIWGYEPKSVAVSLPSRTLKDFAYKSKIAAKTPKRGAAHSVEENIAPANRTRYPLQSQTPKATNTVTQPANSPSLLELISQLGMAQLASMGGIGGLMIWDTLAKAWKWADSHKKGKSQGLGQPTLGLNAGSLLPLPAQIISSVFTAKMVPPPLDEIADFASAAVRLETSVGAVMPIPVPGPGPWPNPTPKVHVPKKVDVDEIEIRPAITPQQTEAGEALWTHAMGVVSQLEPDEMRVEVNEDRTVDIYLGGVSDFGKGVFGAHPTGSVRDIDTQALPAMFGKDNAYKDRVEEQIRELIETGVIPRGSKVRIWAHSYGAMTAQQLAADPEFNGGLVNVVAIGSAGYYDNNLIKDVPDDVTVLSAQNNFDLVVAAERLALEKQSFSRHGPLPRAVVQGAEFDRSAYGRYLFSKEETGKWAQIQEPGENKMIVNYAGEVHRDGTYFDDYNVKNMSSWIGPLPNRRVLKELLTSEESGYGHEVGSYSRTPDYVNRKEFDQQIGRLGELRKADIICNPKVMAESEDAPPAHETCRDN